MGFHGQINAKIKGTRAQLFSVLNHHCTWVFWGQVILGIQWFSFEKCLEIHRYIISLWTWFTSNNSSPFSILILFETNTLVITPKKKHWLLLDWSASCSVLHFGYFGSVCLWAAVRRRFVLLPDLCPKYALFSVPTTPRLRLTLLALAF